jgi:hypothetical protein
MDADPTCRSLRVVGTARMTMVVSTDAISPPMTMTAS